MRRPRVEILYFEGCPNHGPSRELVERIAAELRVVPDIDLVEVTDADSANELRFLGSPTVRVNGRDVEPGAEERRDFAFSCRIYQTDQGLSGQPSTGWIREALTEAGKVSTEHASLSDRGEQLPPRVAAALAAAEIPPSKLGAARRRRLSKPELELYFWILRRFRTQGRPSDAEIGEAAKRHGLDAEHALERLAREDLVHRDRDSQIAVAYPFSGRPTAHRVRFPGGHEVFAMCAIDALGIAPMFREPIEVSSQDPLSGDEIRSRVEPDGDADWWPPSAVVVAGVLDRQGDSCACCCPVLNFFASTENAERWLAEHPEVRGDVITMQEAIVAGRAVFGDVLRED